MDNDRVAAVKMSTNVSDSDHESETFLMLELFIVDV